MKKFNVMTISVLGMVLAGCGQSGSKSESAEEVRQMSAFNLNFQPLNKTVCDPLAQGLESPGGLLGGLRTELYYLNSTQPHYSHLDDYFNFGTKSDQTLFFSRIFTPTREFSTGFTTETGESLKANTGEKLVEYFALHQESVLKLNADQAPGDYEVALISDDGSRMKIRDTDGVWKTIINFDQDTKTRMSCSTQRLHFDSGTQFPLVVDYFQGPRYAIALVAMMRKVDGSTPAESLCGHASLTEFFDPGNGSVGGPAYNALLSRGWRVISSDNFELPVGFDYNPCAGTDVPVISNVRVTSVSREQAILEWVTDRPASSQVLYREGAVGPSTLTLSDNVLRLRHKVTIDNLKPKTSYSVQSVSISYSLGHSTSEPITIVTNE